MYKISMVALALIASQVTADSLEVNNQYAELDILYFSSPGDFDGEQTLGLTLGYQWSKKHAFETELQINGLDSQKFGFDADADLVSYLLGYRYNFNPSSQIRYFAGVGLGYTQAEYFVDPTNKAEQSLIMPFARVGVDYDFSPNAYVSAEFRYQHIPDIDKHEVHYEIGSVPVVGISIGYRF